MGKILYIEDTENNRILLSRYLQKKGYEVWTAEDAGQGIALALSLQPELILMDMGLPGVDGWEATQRLRSHPQTRQIPVLALTAHVMEGDREKALEAGCDDYDTKPFQFPRLLSKIEVLLSKKSKLQTGAVRTEKGRTDILAQIRHDLRNPLSHIVGFAEFILERAADKAAARDLHAICEQGHRMIASVNEALNERGFRELEGNGLELELERGAALIAGLAEKWAGSPEAVGSERSQDFVRIREAAREVSSLSQTALRALKRPETLEAIRQQSHTREERGKEIGTPGREKRTILVVDDFPEVGKVVEQILGPLGYRVIGRNSGEEALELVQGEKVDVILLDISMPGLGGVETLKRLKANPRSHDIPVLMLTFAEEAEQISRCLESGAAGFLAKPFKALMLQARIETALAGANPRE